MHFYFAPMEGVTGYIFRRTVHDQFGGFDKYFAPFIAAGVQVQFHNRERRDTDPKNNAGIKLVPQIMTNHAEAFCKTARILLDMGYQEINLNLGCPSRTVIHKGKGAGFLKYPDKLDAFLNDIYAWSEQQNDLKISIKTRLGFDSAAEFPNLLRIFEQYPVYELIVHARVQSQYYDGKPDIQSFDAAVGACSIPLCYNGSIFSVDDFKQFHARHNNIDHIMLARGAVSNPALALECLGRGQLKKDDLRHFHDAIFEKYRDYLGDPRSLLFKMKELWSFFIVHFDNSEKYIKKVRKAVQVPAYTDAVLELFDSCSFR